MSTISAGTASGTALVNTGDTTGTLVSQTNNGVTALTLDASQNATFAGNVTVSGTLTGPAIFPAFTLQQIGLSVAPTMAPSGLGII